MSITGAGNYFAFNGLIAQAGNLADGTLSLTSGVYSFAALDIAINNPAGPSSLSASVDLSDGADVSVSDLFGEAGGSGGFALRASVGRSYSAEATAYGRLTVAQGARLTLNPLATYQPGIGTTGGYDTLKVGIGAGGTGRVEVTGPGSHLVASGPAALIRIGALEGVGSLDITEGGTVESFRIEAGNGITSAKPALGQITVDGAGSRLLIGRNGSHVDPSFQGLAGGASIGLSSPDPLAQGAAEGRLTATNGGQIVIQNEDGFSDFPTLIFGQHAQSIGTGLVSGQGARLAVVQHGASGDDFDGGATLDIGQAGQGNLTVSDGGSVEVLGDGALLAVSRVPADQPLGGQTSSLTVHSGGRVTIDAGLLPGGVLSIGTGVGADGRLDISGTDSHIALSGQGAQLAIGLGGIGTATIDGGARVTIDGPDSALVLGSDGGTGSLMLDGAALSLSGMARISLAPEPNSSATLSLRNGARVESLAQTGLAVLAPLEGASAVVSIDGPDSALIAGDTLLIGADLAPDGSVETAGGEAVLRQTDASQIQASRIVIGEDGLLEFDTVPVTSELTLAGALAVSPGEITEDVIAAAVDIRPGAELRIDVDAFETGQTDHLTLTPVSALDLAEISLALTTPDNARYFIGDRFEFARFAVPVPDQTALSSDLTSGRALRLMIEDGALSVEALQGVSLTIRPDGSVGQILLPAAKASIDAGRDRVAAPELTLPNREGPPITDPGAPGPDPDVIPGDTGLLL